MQHTTNTIFLRMCQVSFMNVIYRGSYMSAHALLNVLNEFGKRYARIVEHFITFHNELNTFIPPLPTLA